MKKKQTAIISLTLLLLISCIAIARPVAFDAGQLKVMSFNVRVDVSGGWGGRCRKVCNIMSDQDADIIGVQEALSHQVSQIQNALPRYANYAVGRSDGMQKGESCAIFYKKDRFKLSDSGTFWFSDTPDTVSRGWDAWPRICTWVYLTDNTTGRGFYVYNVHLAAFFASGARKKSTELLAERVAARKTNDPFIVMGDFNMKSTSSAMEVFLNADGQTSYARMTDAWQTVHPGDRGPRYDHITMCEQIRALDIQIDERKASDHYAIVAKLQLSAPMKVSAPIAAETEIPRPATN